MTGCLSIFIKSLAVFDQQISCHEQAQDELAAEQRRIEDELITLRDAREQLIAEFVQTAARDNSKDDETF